MKGEKKITTQLFVGFMLVCQCHVVRSNEKHISASR